jgi:hypothetical protein
MRAFDRRERSDIQPRRFGDPLACRAQKSTTRRDQCRSAPGAHTAADLGCCAVRSRQIGDGADLDNRCGSGTAAHARRRQAGLRAVSNDRCLAPGCRRTVTWIEDLADGGVTSW